MQEEHAWGQGLVKAVVNTDTDTDTWLTEEKWINDHDAPGANTNVVTVPLDVVEVFFKWGEKSQELRDTKKVKPQERNSKKSQILLGQKKKKKDPRGKRKTKNPASVTLAVIGPRGMMSYDTSIVQIVQGYFNTSL